MPCGIADKAVTSMEKELDKKLDMNAVQTALKENMANIFDFDYV